MWQWLKNLLGLSSAEPKPDPRPDPEDKKAYDFVAELGKEYDEVGTYFQSLKGGGKPSDTEKELKSATKGKSPANYDWWVDVYDGPKGRGYQVCFEVKRGQDTYRKVINLGPEEHREMDWTKTEAPLPPGQGNGRS